MYERLGVPQPSTLSLRRLERVDAEGEFHVHGLLEKLGEDPSREGLQGTPRRVWQSMKFLTDGYEKDPFEVVGDAVFEQQYDEMVTVRNIEFYSLCEHHLLPFFGRVHVAYLPQGRIAGLSKLARLVDIYSHRLQVQERLTVEIADAVDEVLQPKGVGVVIEASHLCLMMRGVQKQTCETVTSAMRGTFKTDARTRAEFLDLLKKR